MLPLSIKIGPVIDIISQLYTTGNVVTRGGLQQQQQQYQHTPLRIGEMADSVPGVCNYGFDPLSLLGSIVIEKTV